MSIRRPAESVVAELALIQIWDKTFDLNDAVGRECRKRRAIELMTELSKNEVSSTESDEPSARFVLCTLAHTLQNKLSVILGQCDLLAEHLSADPESGRRLHSIRDAAQQMTDAISESECPGGAH
jgi:signal transduction histidine kinase